jgi:hypothetical protein
VAFSSKIDDRDYNTNNLQDDLSAESKKSNRSASSMASIKKRDSNHDVNDIVRHIDYALVEEHSQNDQYDQDVVNSNENDESSLTNKIILIQEYSF